MSLCVVDRKSNATGVFFSSMAMIFSFGFAPKDEKDKQLGHLEQKLNFAIENFVENNSVFFLVTSRRLMSFQVEQGTLAAGPLFIARSDFESIV